MKKGVILLLVVILMLGICINLTAADEISVYITFQPSNVIISDGDMNIKVVTSNSSGYLEGQQIDFTFDNSLIGSVTPDSETTNSSGVALATLHASSQGGIGNLTVSVHYDDAGVPKVDNKIYTVQVVPYPDYIKIETRDLTTDAGKIWVVANGSDKAKVSVWPINTTLGNYQIPFLRTDFSISPTEMGSIAPSIVVGGSDGRANSIFTSGTKSGEVQITGKVFFPGGTANNHTTLLIDHDYPYSLDWFDAPVQALVGDNVTIKVHYRDQFNNSIDNRRFTEYVTFSVTSPSSPNTTTQAEFWNGTAFTPSLTIPLDANGVATGIMRMDTEPGTNKITVHPTFSGVSDKVINIEGIGGSIPVVIEQQFSSYSVPDPYPNIPADGINVFTILYTLRDQYGNGVKNAYFWMNTSLGESTRLSTNLTGQVKVTYGPKIRTDIITITSTAETPKPDSTYATNSKIVEIVATDPVQMVIMANPQLLPSWDVPGNKTAEIKAVVMDQYGNPVKNQPVNFTIGSSHYSYSSGNSPRWAENGLTSIQRNTSSQAYAVANFIPGYFPGFGVPPEHDNCTVTARWGSYPPQTAFLQWTNVPFLSISTNVTPLVAAWNDIVNVEIKVEGNGYALRPKPIDVVLVLDRSGSMDEHDISPSRMDAAKKTAKEFVGKMNLATGRDRVGVVSFGSDTTVNIGLSSDANSVNSSIDSLHANGATMMRNGYYQAIKLLKQSDRDDSVKAVIIMTDGNWNLHGSPIANGKGYNYTPEYSTSYDNPGKWPGINTIYNEYQWYDFSWYGGNYGNMIRKINNQITLWYYNYGWNTRTMTKTFYRCDDGSSTLQNMSIFATDGTKKVKVYTIGFAQNLDDNVENDLTTLSTATGGYYKWAGNEQALKSLYDEIAGLLREEAGVGVTMDLPFNDITIATNTSSWPMEGKDVFDYLKFTDEWKYWSNGTSIYRNQYRDDTSNWTSNDISFNIGTIKLNQIWDAKYRLKVKNTTLNVGRITFFDEDSVIQFSDGKQWYSVSLPTTYLTCIGGQPQTPIGGEEVSYSLETPSIENTYVTQEFTRNFMRNGTAYVGDWDRTWYETYYISIPGCRGLTKIGQAVIPTPVSPSGTYTFDIGPYLCEGMTTVNFNFYVEGTDNIIGGSGGNVGNFVFDPNKIYILLK